MEDPSSFMHLYPLTKSKKRWKRHSTARIGKLTWLMVIYRINHLWLIFRRFSLICNFLTWPFCLASVLSLEFPFHILGCSAGHSVFPLRKALGEGNPYTRAPWATCHNRPQWIKSIAFSISYKLTSSKRLPKTLVLKQHLALTLLLFSPISSRFSLCLPSRKLYPPRSVETPAF